MVAGVAMNGGAATTDAPGIEHFERHIRPLLVESCYSCHSAQAEKGIKGGLVLDTRDGLLKGGDTGPAIVVGDPEKSLLIKAVRYHDENLQMPPKGKKLSDPQIDALVAWVKMGAPDPRTGQSAAKDPKREAAKHWAFQPVKEPAVPPVRSKKLVQNPIDSFLLSKLEAKGLSLSPRADRRTLLRRATYDLLGLPPTAAQVTEFENDRSPDAYAKLIDRLLASPHYGERWPRYGLDCARSAGTHARPGPVDAGAG